VANGADVDVRFAAIECFLSHELLLSFPVYFRLAQPGICRAPPT
jgi:hypothetical protein